jgi:2,3-diketo-5-methylthio-1-phosphopentane phosphatase
MGNENQTIVFCDFDGTISKKDTINDFLDKFADKKWLEIEKDWVDGKISTINAMKSQFGLIKGMTQEKFDNFFEKIEIDDYFKEFYAFAKSKGIKIVILSDGFEYFVRRVLEKNGIDDIEIYSNHFEFKDGQFIMDFPNYDSNCERKAGTCKCSFIEKFRHLYKKVIYIGDGASDFCPAKKVDFLFAKKQLLNYCIVNDISHIKYGDFKEVINNDNVRW